MLEVYAYVNRKRRQRKGRGFSNRELEKAGISFTQALKLGIPIDPRRSTVYDQNVETLTTHLSKQTPTIRVEVELTAIRGIGPKKYEKFKAAGIDSIEKLAQRQPHEIAEKLGVSENTASRWIENAKTLLPT